MSSPRHNNSPHEPPPPKTPTAFPGWAEAGDEDLVAAARDGRTRAFDELIRRYQRRLYAVIYHMTSNHEDTDDLLQETFAKAYRSLKRFQGRSRFYTWIYSIAVNLTLNHLRKRRRRAAFSLDDFDPETGENDALLEDTTLVGDTLRRLHTREIQEKLNEAFQRLSDDHRAVITMHDVEDMPHAEIAGILGVSEGTVRSRLFYARRQIQGLLGDLLK